jgi:hypothetical protein
VVDRRNEYKLLIGIAYPSAELENIDIRGKNEK